MELFFFQALSFGAELSDKTIFLFSCLNYLKAVSSQACGQLVNASSTRIMYR